MKAGDVTSEFLVSLLESITERIIVVDPGDFRILYANRAFRETYGQADESPLGKHCYEVTHQLEQPCHQAETACPVKNVFETGNPSTVVHKHVKKDGSSEFVRLTAYPVRNRDGVITGVIETSTDITAEALLKEELNRKSDLFEKILITSPDGIIGNDRKGNIFLFNAGAEKIFGYSRDEVIGKINVSEIYPPGKAKEVKKILYSDIFGSKGEVQDFETEVLGREGKAIPIRLSANLLIDKEGEIGTIGFFHDISSRKALKEALLESEESYRGIFESARDAILTVGEDRLILKVNNSALELLGHTRIELDGKNIVDILPPQLMDRWDIMRSISHGTGSGIKADHIELKIMKKNGVEFPALVSMSETLTRSKTVITIIFRDISERVASEEELRVLSITDHLTGLFNRRHFNTLAEKELFRSNRRKEPVSILMIDLDRFKKYNDSYGHQEGDKVLAVVAKLIKESIRALDSGFRFGGEEFVALLPNTDSIGAMIPAERFRVMLSETPFTPVPGGGPVHITASIGIAEHRKEEGLDKLLFNADMAMYTAKNSGRNRCISFEQYVSKTMKQQYGKS